MKVEGVEDFSQPPSTSPAFGRQAQPPSTPSTSSTPSTFPNYFPQQNLQRMNKFSNFHSHKSEEKNY
jgi:hypothetical protein